MDFKISEGLRNAFTLTEVLLAIAIVGVIAVLVLPATVSKFHNEVLVQQLDRQEKAIKSALDTLVVTENKANFGETMMYAGSVDADMDETAGKFIKKYLKVAKYYGTAASNADTIKSECFASSYFEYGNNAENKYDKKPYDISGDLVGACAKLKNGASICIEPQKGQQNVQVVMDLNGPKGPNIVGRDYNKFSIPAVQFISFSTGTTSVEVTNQANPDLQPDPDNPCEVGDFGTPCCTYYMNKGVINTGTHECCNNPEIRPLVPACASDIQLTLNLYPTSSCNLKDSSCKAWVQSGSTAKQNGSTISELPATPPNISLYCDGKYSGSLSGAALKEHIKSQASAYFTLNHLHDVNVVYTSGEGISSAKCSVVFEGDHYKNYAFNGVNWSIKYY